MTRGGRPRPSRSSLYVRTVQNLFVDIGIGRPSRNTAVTNFPPPMGISFERVRDRVEIGGLGPNRAPALLLETAHFCVGLFSLREVSCKQNQCKLR